MKMTKVDEIRKRFAAAKAVAPTANISTPLDNYGKFNQNIDKAIRQFKEDTDKKAGPGKFSWWRKEGSSYVFKVGRRPLVIDGAEWFKAPDVKTVISMWEEAKEMVLHDADIRKQIDDYYSGFEGKGGRKKAD